ncbi:hypothetical protein CRG98_030330 [Punica granatum]|uniref:Uncharacterized protein n=1 Tax=Punica granatum TaxID=22663 RepID=A0A2I0IZ57_PUNGR|nr:hypothetical protein CRG98_030330 [Punica granatum]
MTFRNSTGFPEGRFSGHKRLLANLRGTFMDNRDHSDPRTPRDTRETLRKPRYQVPRSPPANAVRTIGSRDRYRGHIGPLRVPFRSTTLASRAITFKGFLTTLTLSREEVVTVRGPIHHPPLRSPTSPILHRAVVGASVPTPFSPSCRGCHLSGPSTRSFQPSLATLKATSPTLFLVHRG